MSKSNYESIFDSIKVTQAHGPQPKNLDKSMQSRPGRSEIMKHCQIR